MVRRHKKANADKIWYMEREGWQILISFCLYVLLSAAFLFVTIYYGGLVEYWVFFALATCLFAGRFTYDYYTYIRLKKHYGFIV